MKPFEISSFTQLAQAPPVLVSRLDHLTIYNVESRLEIGIEYGSRNLVLIHCYGRIDGDTRLKLSAAFERALEFEYNIFLLDFSYCTVDESALARILEPVLERNVSIINVASITLLSNHWNCNFPDVLSTIITWIPTPKTTCD